MLGRRGLQAAVLDRWRKCREGLEIRNEYTIYPNAANRFAHWNRPISNDECPRESLLFVILLKKFRKSKRL
ncbi:hypothetical protein BES34_009975 [Leptospira inadai serovar Lyme]|uniref:Uncharacterized protein n=1 Tax=Leptospira inadai serovar Lyme TaxID=293084 RepID=A0ABX4YIW4_9LEPT|nr:hypothetical protein BES34_009975 [Leptospira inadai serovar Lyme]